MVASKETPDPLFPLAFIGGLTILSFLCALLFFGFILSVHETVKRMPICIYVYDDYWMNEECDSLKGWISHIKTQVDDHIHDEYELKDEYKNTFYPYRLKINSTGSYLK